jgi:hypothetical protein
MALQAFWPLLAQAKPRSVALVPVCTVEGVTHYLELPAGKTPGGKGSAAHFEHCALCTLGDDRAPAVQTGSCKLDSSGAAGAPVPRIALFLPLPLEFSPARPRAPPTAS